MCVTNEQKTKVGPSAAFASVAFLVVSMLISGCAVNNKDLTADLVSNEEIVTGSVAQPNQVEGVELSDAEIIKDSVVAAPVVNDTSGLAWSNPETGSSGKIVTIGNFLGKHGQKCRVFKTSVDTFRGISFYNGEACEISSEKWVLSWFKPAE